MRARPATSWAPRQSLGVKTKVRQVEDVEIEPGFFDEM
jgi:hypothetical protein